MEISMEAVIIKTIGEINWNENKRMSNSKNYKTHFYILD